MTISMNKRPAAALLLVVQMLLVLSVAGKYLYERKTRPRVWVRATQFDPDQPLRGRYLALQLLVDACSLPRDAAHLDPFPRFSSDGVRQASWTWNISLFEVNGRMMPRLEAKDVHREDVQQLTAFENKPCDRIPLLSSEEYFIPEHAQTPFPLKPGEELWVEVTLPPSGPPRPIQLAMANQSSFRPLKFE